MQENNKASPPRWGALLPISTLPFGGNFKYAHRRLLLFSNDFTVDEAQKVANKVGIETGFPRIPTIRKAREEMGGGDVYLRGALIRGNISVLKNKWYLPNWVTLPCYPLVVVPSALACFWDRKEILLKHVAFMKVDIQLQSDNLKKKVKNKIKNASPFHTQMLFVLRAIFISFWKQFKSIF